MDFNSLEFAHPFLALLAPLPLLAWLLLPRSEVRKSFTALRAHDFKLWDSLASHTRQSSRIIILLLVVIIWVCLVVAAMRPQIIGKPLEEPQKGRGIMLAVDLSGSMLQDDVRLGNQMVTRIDLVKSVVGDFVKRREGDRLGLILFGTRPFLQAPLTADLNAVREYLDTSYIDQSRSQELSLTMGGNTHISRAVGLGIKHLKEVDAEHRVLLLLTDGEPSSDDIDHSEVALIAKKEGVKIYSISFKGAHDSLRNSENSDIEIKDFARISGGKYFFAQGGDGLRDAYAAFDELEPFSAKPAIYRLNRDIFYWPLGLALLLSLLVGFVKSREHV